MDRQSHQKLRLITNSHQQKSFSRDGRIVSHCFHPLGGATGPYSPDHKRVISTSCCPNEHELKQSPLQKGWIPFPSTEFKRIVMMVSMIDSIILFIENATIPINDWMGRNLQKNQRNEADHLPGSKRTGRRQRKTKTSAVNPKKTTKVWSDPNTLMFRSEESCESDACSFRNPAQDSEHQDRSRNGCFWGVWRGGHMFEAQEEDLMLIFEKMRSVMTNPS